MEEFLKINWRSNDLTELDPQSPFISEEVISDSLVYKFFQDKSLFKPRKAPSKIFKQDVYIPGNIQIRTPRKSGLDEWAHKHCLKAIKLFQSGKAPFSYTKNEQYSIEVFNKMKATILEENSRYEAFVSEQWQKSDRGKLLTIKRGLVSFGQQVWERKWKRISSYPQFFKELSVINMTFDENENIIDFKCLGNVLELGALARFSQPCLKSACRLNNVTLPSESDPPHFKSPVSQDQNVSRILEARPDIDLVISSSSLKCITDTSDLKKKWMIPVVVKKVTVKTEMAETMTKSVVFVDKPFSEVDICHMDFAYISYKRLIKTNFCQYEAFNYNDNNFPSEQTVKIENDSGLIEESASPSRPKNRHHNTIHHNATYKIWNIKKTYCQNNLMKNNYKPVEFNVLIRSKLDACERNDKDVLQPVIVRPKLEMQLKYGANVPSKSELAREWTSLFFTPFSVLYRVRISPTNGEVICVEKCNIQKVLGEAQAHYQYKPQMGLGILQKVFEELISLEPGNYLLQHFPRHEAFVSVLKECKSEPCKQEDVFDFHAEQSKVSISQSPKGWIPIDVNFVLPSFEAAERMPGMFTPSTRQRKKKKTKGPKANNNQTKHV